MVVAVPLVVLLLASLLGLVLGSRAVRRSRCGFVTMHPDQRRWLRHLRLTKPEHFFDLEALLVSGHPGRNVARLVLGSGEQQRRVYLKRESRVRLGTRFRNFLSGFGWVSGPVREAQMLAALEREGLPGPSWLATGEDGSGGAFLLVAEVPGAEPLMAALQARPDSRERRSLAARLGKTLAAVHKAGFFHRDLYAKHVLVGPAAGAMCLLDWQRSTRGPWLSSSASIRDLACLHATLPDDLAGPRERLACLRAYLGALGIDSEECHARQASRRVYPGGVARAAGFIPAVLRRAAGFIPAVLRRAAGFIPAVFGGDKPRRSPSPSTAVFGGDKPRRSPSPSTAVFGGDKPRRSPPSTAGIKPAARQNLECFPVLRSDQRSQLRKLLFEIESLASRLRQRRHIREKRQPPTVEKQEWILLDGQALCITPALVEMTAGQSLDWLRLDQQPLPAGQSFASRSLSLPGGRAYLVRQNYRIDFWQHWWSKMTGRPIVTPVQRQATMLWRLERHGVASGRVLALGERRHGRQVDSFLLSQPLDPVCRLLAPPHPPHPPSPPLPPWGEGGAGCLAPPLPRGERGLGGEGGEGIPTLLHQAGVLLARMHEACCYLQQPDALVVRLDPRTKDIVGLGLEPTLDSVVLERRPCPARARRDLLQLRDHRSIGSGESANERSHIERGYASLQPRVADLSLLTAKRQPAPASAPGREANRTSFWQRLTGAWRRLRQRHDWESFAGPGWADSIMQTGVTDDFHAKQGRSTGRWVRNAPEGGRLVVYLKRHYRLPFWLGWLATLWPEGDWSPAMQEYRHLEWARTQGVPVPDTVAVGEFIGPWGKLESILAVEELTDMLPLHQAIPLAKETLPDDVFRTWKAGLVEEMARVARLLHDRRHFHKDLYLCHFYVHRDDIERVPEGWRQRVVLIDLHRLTYHPWTRWRWLLKDLAQLLYSSEVDGVEVRDRVAFWRHYRGPGANGIGSKWLRRLVMLKWSRYRSHNLRRKRRLGGGG